MQNICPCTGAKILSIYFVVAHLSMLSDRWFIAPFFWRSSCGVRFVLSPDCVGFHQCKLIRIRTGYDRHLASGSHRSCLVGQQDLMDFLVWAVTHFDVVWVEDSIKSQRRYSYENWIACTTVCIFFLPCYFCLKFWNCANWDEIVRKFVQITKLVIVYEKT